MSRGYRSPSICQLIELCDVLPGALRSSDSLGTFVMPCGGLLSGIEPPESSSCRLKRVAKLPKTLDILRRSRTLLEDPVDGDGDRVPYVPGNSSPFPSLGLILDRLFLISPFQTPQTLLPCSFRSRVLSPVLEAGQEFSSFLYRPFELVSSIPACSCTEKDVLESFLRLTSPSALGLRCIKLPPPDM
jgi:hypothetical protein